MIRMTPTTHLLKAAKIGDLNGVVVALADGADVNARDDDGGDLALHHAINSGHLALVEFLIARGANVNAGNSWHRTPLHLASANGQTEIVQLLVKNGANPTAIDDYRHSPLQDADAHSHLDIVA